MILFISILALFTDWNAASHAPMTKSNLLTAVTSKSWTLSSMTPDKRCTSAIDDIWIFSADGTFQFNHGTITENKRDACSDFINITGTWEFKDNETAISVLGLHETGNAANSFAITFMQGKSVF